jgi:hypothetical protein
MPRFVQTGGAFLWWPPLPFRSMVALTRPQPHTEREKLLFYSHHIKKTKINYG